MRSNAIGGTKAGAGHSICAVGDTSTSLVNQQRGRPILHLLQ